MRGSLHAHILTWFRRRELASGFTHLEPIHRAAKATTESRQRPRAHEVPPQPGQIKPGDHYQEDNVSHAPCITYGQARVWCGDGRAARPLHMSTSTPKLAESRPRWSGLPLKAPWEARPSVDSLTRSYGSQQPHGASRHDWLSIAAPPAIVSLTDRRAAPRCCSRTRFLLIRPHHHIGWMARLTMHEHRQGFFFPWLAPPLPRALWSPHRLRRRLLVVFVQRPRMPYQCYDDRPWRNRRQHAAPAVQAAPTCCITTDTRSILKE